MTEGEKNDKFFCDPTAEDGVQSYYIIHHPAYYITHLFTTILLMFLALIEKPSVFAIDEGDATLVWVALHVSRYLHKYTA